MYVNSFKSSQSGFTLIELIVATVVGVFLLGGVMFTYLSMKTTTSDTIEMGELQETGRMALDIIGKDLEMAGFWGSFNGLSLESTTIDVTTVANPGNDCSVGLNNGSFPQNSPSSFKYIFGLEAVDGANMGCITDAVGQSDIIQIKRVSGQNINGQATSANSYYLEADIAEGRMFAGDGNLVNAANANGTVWRYMHHVYYVNEQQYQMGNRTVSVPVLMRKRLTPAGGMTTESVLEGVENIRLLYGIDNDGDRNVDTYLTAGQMTVNEWEQVTSKILTAQLFVLVRAVEEDADLNRTNKTFTLGGDGGTSRTITFADNFRRLLFVSTIKVKNSEVETW